VRLGVLSELRIKEQLEKTRGPLYSTAYFDVRICTLAPPTNLQVKPMAIDTTRLSARLKKELEGLQKAITSKERQLGDEVFRTRAPEKIIKGLEATLADQRIELEKLQRRLKDLEGESQAAGTRKL
jgi:valyl-tRNA synthetase